MLLLKPYFGKKSRNAFLCFGLLNLLFSSQVCVRSEDIALHRLYNDNYFIGNTPVGSALRLRSRLLVYNTGREFDFSVNYIFILIYYIY